MSLWEVASNESGALMSRARKWWQPAEIAAELRVTKWCVNNWIRKGLLRAVRPSATGNHQRVSHEEYERFVEARMMAEAAKR